MYRPRKRRIVRRRRKYKPSFRRVRSTRFKLRWGRAHRLIKRVSRYKRRYVKYRPQAYRIKKRSSIVRILAAIRKRKAAARKAYLAKGRRLIAALRHKKALARETKVLRARRIKQRKARAKAAARTNTRAKVRNKSVLSRAKSALKTKKGKLVAAGLGATALFFMV